MRAVRSRNHPKALRIISRMTPYPYYWYLRKKLVAITRRLCVSFQECPTGSAKPWSTMSQSPEGSAYHFKKKRKSMKFLVLIVAITRRLCVSFQVSVNVDKGAWYCLSQSPEGSAYHFKVQSKRHDERRRYSRNHPKALRIISSVTGSAESSY